MLALEVCFALLSDPFLLCSEYLGLSSEDETRSRGLRGGVGSGLGEFGVHGDDVDPVAILAGE